MTKYLSVKEFRNRLPVIAEDLKRWGEIVILKRSKPLFKIVPFYPTCNKCPFCHILAFFPVIVKHLWADEKALERYSVVLKL